MPASSGRADANGAALTPPRQDDPDQRFALLRHVLGLMMFNRGLSPGARKNMATDVAVSRYFQIDLYTARQGEICSRGEISEDVPRRAHARSGTAMPLPDHRLKAVIRSVVSRLSCVGIVDMVSLRVASS